MLGKLGCAVDFAENGAVALERYDSGRYAVVLMDLSMPVMDGATATEEIHRRFPQIKVVVLTMHRETQLAVDAFRVGASGYLLKVSPADELITAVRRILGGRRYVSANLAERLAVDLGWRQDPGRQRGRLRDDTGRVSRLLHARRTR